MRWITHHPRTSQALGVALALLVALLSFGGYSVRQKQLAQDTLRFYRASDIAKEVAFQLESQAELATTDVRFVSELPPIQGIIDARRSPDADDAESEATWIGRLETILEGLMRHNQSYLAISYMELGEEVRQLCRTERNTQTGFVRRTPHQQLLSFTLENSDHEFRKMLPAM